MAFLFFNEVLFFECLFFHFIEGVKKMKMRSFGRYFLGVLAIALLAGCSSRPYVTHPSTWGSYKCIAHNPHTPKYVAKGWGATEDRARMNALAKCHAHTQYPKACQIMQCHAK